MTNVLSSVIEVKTPNEVSLIFCLFQPVFSPGLLKEQEERHKLFSLVFTDMGLLKIQASYLVVAIAISRFCNTLCNSIMNLLHVLYVTFPFEC